MLVLSRYTNETIVIGDDVVITIIRIAGERVRVGIEAPPHVTVHRGEVYERIERERRACDDPAPDG